MEMMGFSHFEIAGFIGVGLYLGSYAALQTGFLRGSSYTYAICNFLAASFVLTSLAQNFNLSSAIIQISWLVISAVGMMRLYYIRNSMHFSAREREMLERKLPGLPNDLAMTLIRAGNWQSFFAPKTLTEEGKPVSSFYYISSGEARVFRGGTLAAKCREGDFIGEVTCFSGEPATGTVILDRDAELFAIDCEKLRVIAPLGSSLRDALENAIANDLRIKMTRIANPAASGGREGDDDGEVTHLLRDLDLVTAA